MYCTHDRIASSCEDCAFVTAVERGSPVPVVTAGSAAVPKDGRAPRNVAEERPDERVDGDTRVMRTDLDADSDTAGAYTMLRSGDAVPVELADLPREPAPRPGGEATTSRRGKADVDTRRTRATA